MKGDMMTSDELAKIEKVDLREIWPNEAADFTPWLADNLSELGRVLGLDLELQAQEAPVGGYSLDLLARDLGSGGEVVIENQLDTTDHDHLGKLLTYAAGFDARVMVWIARVFRDEHREALDMLNHRTGEETQFFGVELELWKIDDSRPAVNFKLVATPNEWQPQRSVSRSASSTVSDRGERYQSFFQALIDTLREQHRFTGARKGQPQNWYSFASGFSSLTYGANFTSEREARVELYIDRVDKDWNKVTFDRLETDKQSLESAIGEPLVWQRLDNRRASRISVVRVGNIYDDDDTLEEIHDWMVDSLLKFKEVFGPRLIKLAK